MEKWKKELIKYQTNNKLSQVEMVNKINRYGGEINQSAYSQLINKNRQPSKKNSKAIEEILKPQLNFYQEIED